MSLDAGTRIGVYEISSILGAGGMGEVYRARDTKLGRDVALKILPPAFAGDADRLMRFEREARALAALNHPQIAQIYGFEQTDDTSALIMELVEGEDLATRIAGGPLPLDEALPIARQVAAALEAAHEAGIIHRDLKPANVKLRADGTVKVLDFGLAKAAAGETANSPTITSPALTMQGVILGTAAYMSPEQARGRAVDKRADVWAFGCVLYEMLTGRRAFDGDDISSMLASVLKDDVKWDALPADVPPRISTLLRTCLEKDPQKRVPHIAIARFELDQPDTVATDRSPKPTTSIGRSRMRGALWGLGVAAAAVLGFVVAWSRQPVRSLQVVKSTITFPAVKDGVLGFDDFALSPDGQRLAFAYPDATGRRVLWVRSLGSLEAQAIAGTEGVSAPFWSPDGRFVAFSADRKLKRLEIGAGSVTTLADDAAGPGSWNSHGIILFPRYSTRQLHRVSAEGGTVTQVTEAVAGMMSTTYYPWFLPDGNHFLYLRGRVVYVAALDDPTPRTLLEDAGNARYASGHLVFLRETTLFAQAFDAARLTLDGNPVPLAERIRINSGSGAGQFSMSNTGMLVYQSIDTTPSQLTWIDRSGRVAGTLGDPGAIADLHLSGNGRWAAVSMSGRSEDQHDIWLFDVGRGVRTRLTSDEADDTAPFLSTDGSRLLYSSRRGAAKAVYLKPAGGAGEPERLLEDPRDKRVQDWSPDGQHLMYWQFGGTSSLDVWTLALKGDRTPVPVINSAASESRSAFSPDGRFVAYESNESGRPEIYLLPFPPAGRGRPISASGGRNPHWRADGQEIFFLGDAGVMRAPVTRSASGLEIGVAEPLFEVASRLGSRWPQMLSTQVNLYNVTPDGQRFLFALPQDRSQETVTLVVNWPAAMSVSR